MQRTKAGQNLAGHYEITSHKDVQETKSCRTQSCDTKSRFTTTSSTTAQNNITRIIFQL